MYYNKDNERGDKNPPLQNKKMKEVTKMKVKVNYSVIVEKEIEIDDKFKTILTTNDYEEENQLANELIDVVSESLEEYGDIYDITDIETDEMLYEG